VLGTAHILRLPAIRKGKEEEMVKLGDLARRAKELLAAQQGQRQRNQGGYGSGYSDRGDNADDNNDDADDSYSGGGDDGGDDGGGDDGGGDDE
jgi:hypothetical protein